MCIHSYYIGFHYVGDNITVLVARITPISICATLKEYVHKEALILIEIVTTFSIIIVHVYMIEDDKCVSAFQVNGS